jgi:hypothetical protein
LRPAQQLLLQSVALPRDGTTFITGFYPHNLLSTYPFVTSSFINTNFWGVQIEKLLHIPFSRTMQVFRLLDLLILATLAGCIFFRRPRHLRKIVIILITVAATISMSILLLSLIYKAFSYKSSTSLWTWVVDARSFLFPMIVLQLLLFLLVLKAKGSAIIKKTVLLLFVFECIHGIYFTIKQASSSNEIILERSRNTPVKKITSIALDLAIKDKKTSLVTSDNTLRRYALLHHVSSYSFTNEKANLSWMNKGDAYLIATHRYDSSLLNIFPRESLQAMDTLHPFVLHYYKVE